MWTQANNLIKPLLLYSIILLVASSCSSSKSDPSIIAVNLGSRDILDIEEVAENITEIPLQFTDSSLIGEIGRIYFDQGDSLLFFYDFGSNQIMKYDLSGAFLGRIGHVGEGPGEYQYINAFCIDKNSNEVIIATTGRLIKLDYAGNFIKEEKVPGYGNYIELVNDELMLFTSDFGKKDGENGIFNLESMLKLDDDLAIVDSTLLKKVSIREVTGSTYPRAKYFSRSSAGLSFYYPILVNELIVRDTLYTYQNSQLSYELKLDFDLSKERETTKKEVNIKSIIKSDGWLFCEYLKEGSWLFAYNQSTSEKYNMKNGFTARNYVIDDYIELFPDISDKNLFYFSGKPISDAPSDMEPNPSIFLLTL